jgi:hypothetical protein
MKMLLDAGLPLWTVRGWFFKITGPRPSKIPELERILGRDIETIIIAPAAPVPVIEKPAPEPMGTGFCWVPFSAWEPLSKEEVCALCVQKNEVCRKAVAVA